MAGSIARQLGRLSEAQSLAILFGGSTAILGGLVATKGEPDTVPRWIGFRELYSSGYCTAFCGTMVMNWTDVSKVRMQTESLLAAEGAPRKYTTFARTLSSVYRAEGLWVLWGSGIVSSCYRDVFYSSIRYGAYPLVKEALFPASAPGQDIGFAKKWMCGVLTGGIGAAIANPSDIVMIRMKAEGGRIKDGVLTTGLYAGKKPRYTNGFEGLVKLFQNEGIRAAYAGTSATAMRAALGTGAQVAAYDHTKHLCKQYKIPMLDHENVFLHVFSALIAGLAFTTCAAPADVIKSRYMAEPGRFSSVFDCAVSLVRTDGVRGLFRGWTPGAARICPLFMIMTPILEQCRKHIGLGWYAA